MQFIFNGKVLWFAVQLASFNEAFLLNQARTWFLEIVSVRTSVCVCVCVCVCVRPRGY